MPGQGWGKFRLCYELGCKKSLREMSRYNCLLCNWVVRSLADLLRLWGDCLLHWHGPLWTADMVLKFVSYSC
jgi:hypothetical protein